MNYIITRASSDELKHFGIKGQKWGVRRYENEDGTLTPEGKERYYGGNKSSYDRKTLLEKAIKNRPQGLSEEDNKIISRLQNGEVLSDNELYKIARTHYNKRKQLDDKLGAASSENEKASLKKSIDREETILDYAYGIIPSINSENQYKKEIATETDKKYIDPSYREFSSKSEKASAEADYLRNTWHSEMPRSDENERKKWERECVHLMSRVAGLSYDGHAENPKSDNVRSMFDPNPEEIGGYLEGFGRWTPKYEKSNEWKKILADEKMLEERTGFAKAKSDIEKAQVDGLYISNKRQYRKLLDAWSKAQKKYLARLYASDIKSRKSKIIDAFNKEITKRVLQDIGYEVNNTNMYLIKSVIYYG